VWKETQLPPGKNDENREKVSVLTWDETQDIMNTKEC
jgi:hypothetical protein